MTRDGLANKALALAVARTLADSPEIRQGLQKKPQESGIQAIAEAVRKRNDLLFIVVTDMHSLRYSHPEAQRTVFATRILKPSVLVSHLKVMTSLKR